jgi:hypothetical protein
MTEEFAFATAHQRTPETLFWRVVIARTIQDWLSNSADLKRGAERYLFQNSEDLSLVCASAGINVNYLRDHLNKIRGHKLHEIVPHDVFPREVVPLAA